MNKWSSLLSLLIFNNCRELRSDHGMLTCGLVGYFAELKYFDWAEMWLTTHYFWLASRMNKSTGRMKENWVLRLLFYKERNVWVVCVCVCVCVCVLLFSLTVDESYESNWCLVLTLIFWYLQVGCRFSLLATRASFIYDNLKMVEGRERKLSTPRIQKVQCLRCAWWWGRLINKVD